MLLQAWFHYEISLLRFLFLRLSHEPECEIYMIFFNWFDSVIGSIVTWETIPGILVAICFLVSIWAWEWIAILSRPSILDGPRLANFLAPPSVPRNSLLLAGCLKFAISNVNLLYWEGLLFKIWLIFWLGYRDLISQRYSLLCFGIDILNDLQVKLRVGAPFDCFLQKLL